MCIKIINKSHSGNLIIKVNNSRMLVVLLFSLFFVLQSINMVAQTKTSTGSGNWNNANTWSPSGVPTSANDVIITGNHKINIVSNSVCKSLTVGTGGSAQLRFRTSGSALTVKSNIVVSNSARFRVRSNGSYTLFAGGDITNSGTIDFYPNNNRHVDLILTNNGNQNISGNGILTNLYLVKLNMGSSFDNIADFSTSSFVVPTNFLKLTNGTFKYSKVNALSIIPFSSAITIPSTAGFWMNAPTSIVSIPDGMIISGKLSVSNGTLNAGVNNNDDLFYSSGTFSFTGGVTNVTSRFNGNSAASICVFNMSGGTMNINASGSTNSSNAPFQISTAGSQFNMSGGTIVIHKSGSGGGNQNLGYVNLAGSGSVTGGTLQIGSAFSNQTIKINSSASIGNLLVNNSTATASLITNSINVVNDVVINSGTLDANNLNITIGGNWQHNGGTFKPTVATVIFSSASVQNIFKSGGETFTHLAFTGSGAKTLLSAVTATGNLTINSGSNLDVSASNYQVTVKGNLSNSGTFNTRSGLVLLNGTSTQTVSGSSITDFFDLTLNNTNGALLSSPQKLYGTLNLNNGTLNTSFNNLTMVSTATATARIAQMTGSGNITGLQTVQRFAPGGTTGWALIGTPMSTALSFADWDDNIYISCPTCPDGQAGNFLSIYSYDETVSGSYSNTAAYIPISTINDPILANKGYWVYLGDGYTTTNDITLDVIGTVRKFNQTIPLNYTNYGSPGDDGWNLIHNPYPSPISWTALKGSTSNIDNAIYVWNADLNGGAGANAAYVNGVSSPAVGSGGIGDVIPMCQAFYVHSTGATALNGTEAVKVAGNPTFLRESSAQNPNSIMRLKMTGPSGYVDESVLYIQTGATSNFDGAYDAIKMAGQDPSAPIMALEVGNKVFQVNGIAPINGTYTTSLKTLTGHAGIYKIGVSELSGFPIGACISLYDKFTATSTDISSASYIFNLSDTTSIARFILSITINPLQISSNLIQPTCQNANGGKVSAIGLSSGPWNYYWKDENGHIIRTALNKNTADSLTGLWGGAVDLEITTVGLCDNSHSSYSIIQKSPINGGFYCVDTCYLSVDPVIQLNNTITNASSLYWNFGDNSGVSTAHSPDHQYTSEGIYEISLIANSFTGCTDTLTKTVVVADKPVGIKTNSFNGSDLIVKTLTNNKFLVEKSLQQTSNLSYQLIDGLGRILLNEKNIQTNKLNIALDLNAYKAGVYFLKIDLDNKNSVIKLPVKN